MNGFFSPSFEKNDGKESILKTLAYFDIFRYPLTIEEITRFMDQPADNRNMEQWLAELQANGEVFLNQGCYSIQDNPLLVHRRHEGEHRAKQLLVKANKIGRFLYQFPFVRAVAISGSLSKNFADEKADIDLFIITRANRLWIARTFMHLYKKLTYLRGRQHYYCMNYYLDEEALLLEDKNIYTAIELKTLLPVCGSDVTRDFFNANQWANEWLPSCEYKTQQQKDPWNNFLKRSVEWFFNNRFADALDKYLMRITDRRWQVKQKKGKKNNKGIPMIMLTGRHFAKSDPGNFQAKVLQQYEQRSSEILGIPYSPLTVSSVR